MKKINWKFILLTLTCLQAYSQDISLYNQVSGKYDFTFIGNTLNQFANFNNNPCVINTSSAATLNLSAENNIHKAYLYWAGSGTGDLTVALNQTVIASQRNFTFIQVSNGRPYFCAFADVTNLVQTTGNGTYTLSDLDLTTDIQNYCSLGGNFGGWSLVIIFQNDSLPINLINIYDGLQGVPSSINFTLNNLNIIDNANSKIGFVAWEGDAQLAQNETLRINNNILSNPPLNPANNAFNGTNSVTGSNQLFNMDLDIYDMSNFINIGDTTADIQLTSNQDFVMISTVVTKVNSQITLPDATVAINNIGQECDSRIITINYTVNNIDPSNAVLPAGTPMAIYINGSWFQNITIPQSIAINGSYSNQISLTIPSAIPNDFLLTFTIDDNGTGIGIVDEINEENNFSLRAITLWVTPTFNSLATLISCNEGFTSGTFDFSAYEDTVKTNPDDVVSFYESAENATNSLNPILIPSNYVATTTPKEIFVRIENDHCFAITSFLLTTKNCPPTVYNFVSANNDTQNDIFFIAGLRDIFLNHKIEVYNRWGRQIWEGNQNTESWDGNVKDGVINKSAPDGTYFYFIHLNDPDYPKPLSGYLYLVH